MVCCSAFVPLLHPHPLRPSSTHISSSVLTCSLPSSNIKNQRASLISLLSETPSPSPKTILASISELTSLTTDQPVADNLNTSDSSPWVSRLEGTWQVVFSTEPALVSVLSKPSNAVFQVVRSTTLENRIEWADPPVHLKVSVDYHPRADSRIFDFVFKKTRVDAGKSVGADTWYDVSLSVPFAVGKGFVKCLWLDHALRIDRDTSNGKDWINVYMYKGPADKCTVGF